MKLSQLFFRADKRQQDKDDNKRGKPSFFRRTKQITPAAPWTSWVPMIRIAQAPDHYLIKLVMPKVEVKSDWVTWDGGRLRLAIPGSITPFRPAVLRWIKLPTDVDKVVPKVSYEDGCLRIEVPRKVFRRSNASKVQRS